MISIIVPIYNTDEVYLRECLNSILMQTFVNWEAILVDDGSTDNTGKIIDEYAKKDPRFIAIHKQNEGTLLARKTGLENSRGEYIANIDHDDTYNPQFLEKMYAKITETNADFVYCKCQIADEKYYSYCVKDYKWSTELSENVAMMLRPNSGTSNLTWNKLIRKNIYSKVNFPNVHLTIGEDPIQMVQVAYHSKSAAYVSENLYFHRLESGLTSIVSFSVGKIQKSIYAVLILNKVLENTFNKSIPQNVKTAFYSFCKFVPYIYFLLNKEVRTEFKKELEPLMPEFIKFEKSLNLKICLLLANKGIEFPFMLRENIKKWTK